MAERNKAWEEAALSDSPFAWWEWDVVTNRLQFNALKASMLGYSPENFRGRGFQAFTELLHPDDYPKTMDAMHDVLAGRARVFHADYRIRAADGSYHWYMDRGYVVARDANGTPSRIRGIVVDLGREARAGNKVETLVRILSENAKQEGAVVPLCASCRRVESDGQWLPFQQDLSRMAGLPVSHGLCAECLRRLYPEIADDVMRELDVS